jgi:endonuclease YncB( thermonuclease family)
MVVRPKKLILFVILVALCLSSMAVDYQEVRFVYDGDTILLGMKDKVRYLGINAPEIDHNGGKSEFMAQAAKDFNLQLVNNAEVILEYDKKKRDRHGRLLAYVFLKNGDMVNALLVRNGLAHVMFNNRCLKYRDILLDCQRKAMREKTGIWSISAKREEQQYLGNKYSYRFHLPECPFAKKISQRNLVRFASRYDCFWEGYSPCKKCRP